MASVQQKVSILLSKEVSLQKGLTNKLINTRALARYLKEKYHLEASLDSIISAVRRYDLKKIEEDKKKILELLKGAVVSTRNNVACITLRNFSLKDLEKLEKIKSLSFVKGTHEFKVVIDKEYVESLKDLFSNKIIKIEDDLSEVSFVLSEKVLKQKGILAEIANEIYIHVINISEILICPPEFLILVKKKDMVKTHEIIIGLTE
jgi:hypothetical protein